MTSLADNIRDRFADADYSTAVMQGGEGEKIAFIVTFPNGLVMVVDVRHVADAEGHVSLAVSGFKPTGETTEVSGIEMEPGSLFAFLR